MHKNKFIKAKIKSGEISIDFQGKNAVEKGFIYICKTIILHDSILVKDRSYYPRSVSKKV